MSTEVTGSTMETREPVEANSSPDIEKVPQNVEESENVDKLSGNLVYDDTETEPELHLRTYVALGAMFFLNLVQVFALQGPPVVLSYIGADLKDKAADTWVPNGLSLVQAVMSPLIASASDTFQARKTLLVGCTIISFIGAAIAPGSKNIGRIIAAQVLIGVGFATVPLAYCVPSEILPRKWRPMAQSAMNVGAALGSCAAPLIIGSFTRGSTHFGWRNYYWIQMALWGLSSIGIFVGYRPPKRHTRLDHLTFLQKIGRLDLPGLGLLTAGLTLLLVGLNLGGNLFSWKSSQTLVPLVLGIVTLIGFGIYEWKGTENGVLSHELFQGGKDRGRTFALCVSLIFIEGILLFAYIIFYPAMTTALFTDDPFITAAREQPFWIATGLSTVAYGYASTKLRDIRIPLFVGFLLFTSGIIGLATIQPHQSTSILCFAGLAGIGFGGPLVLIIAGVQLSVPHHLIATATALTTSSRAISATVFTAIFVAALNTRLTNYIPHYVAKAAIIDKLPLKSVPGFVEALAGDNTTALLKVPGVTPKIIEDGVAALLHALADGIRVVFIIAAPFGIVACLICFFLGDLRGVMNYRVDAPVEKLHAKHHRGENA